MVLVKDGETGWGRERRGRSDSKTNKEWSLRTGKCSDPESGTTNEKDLTGGREEVDRLRIRNQFEYLDSGGTTTEGTRLVFSISKEDTRASGNG